MRIFWRLLKLAYPFRWGIILAALCGLATIGSSIGLMATAAYIIAKAALQPSIAALQVSIVGVRFFGLARGIFRYLERYLSHQVTFRLLAQLRVWFYRALEPLAPGRLMPYRSGDLLSRIVADIETLQHFYIRVLAPPLVAGLVILLIGLFMAAFEIRLALVTVALLSLAGLILPLLSQRLSKNVGQQLISTRSELNVTLIDGIQGMADLLIAGQETHHQKRVHTLSGQLVNLQEHTAWITGLYSALSGLLAQGSGLIILLLAIPLVNQGQIEGVYLALLVLTVMAGFEAIIPLPEAFQHLENSVAAAGRLFQIVDAQPLVPYGPSSSPHPKEYSLVVENLNFSYQAQPLPPTSLYDEQSSTADSHPATIPEPTEWQLHHISFSLSPSQQIAIVGPSGAGKSTLVNLLLRFWDYQAGQIRLGGYELHHYRPEDVRSLIGVVSQQTHLFNNTIRENLLMAQPEATEADLIQAAGQAQIHEFIQTLPQGYDTWIGEQGLRLSAGERQRLAIARALLKDAPYLILDEATANLDPLTEKAVMTSLQALMDGRTTLIITHRLVRLEAVDEILVLQAGRIIERGQHHDLLEAGKLYRRMWEHQHQKDALEFASFPNVPDAGHKNVTNVTNK